MDWFKFMQGLAIVGMVLLVLAYVLNQKGKFAARSGTYLLMNGVGAFMLTVYSIYIQQWVFALLEGFWCFVSFQPLLKKRA